MSIWSVPYFMGDPMTGFAVPKPNTVVSPALPAGNPQERMAVLAGFQRREVAPLLIWLDAHGDLNT